MTHDEIADMLIRFVDGKTQSWEFDDWISSYQTGELERFRLELSALSESHPPFEKGHYCNPDGFTRIREIAEAIRSTTSN